MFNIFLETPELIWGGILPTHNFCHPGNIKPVYVDGGLSIPCSPPPRDIELGDVVVVGQCRPLSKTVRFNVLKVQKAKGGKKQFQKF